jgi:hypothetical protein
MNILGWLQNSHDWRYSGSSGDYVHFNCQACNEGVGNSGVYSVGSNTMSCFQPNCIFSKESEGWVPGYVYLKFVENWDYKSASDRVKKFQLHKSTRKKRVNPNARPWLPKGLIPLNKGRGELAEKLDVYIRSRNFTRDELYAKYNLHYVAVRGQNRGSGKNGDFYGRIIFPFYNIFGSFKYFQARTFIDDDLRWKNPDVVDFGIGKTELIYNENKFRFLKKDLTIHEGLFDVYETEQLPGIIGTSLGGTSISPYQLIKIQQSKAENVYVILDPYTAKAAYSIALSLLCEGKRIFIVSLKEGDCSEIGYKKVGQAMVNHVIELTFQNFMEIKSRIYKEIVEVEYKDKEGNKRVKEEIRYHFAPKKQIISFYE